MKMDVHVMDNVWDGHKWCQKIRRTYHFEDWTLALDEMLTGRRPFKFQHPYVRPDRNLTEVPRSIDNFYKKILSDVSVGGKNTTLLEETVHDDWSRNLKFLGSCQGMCVVLHRFWLDRCAQRRPCASPRHIPCMRAEVA